jgi:tRNA G18 (ribose-2'-O)-methylase SpoU
MNFFTEKKFRKISEERKHFYAANILKNLWTNYNAQQWKQYQTLASWLNLEKITYHRSVIADRYHFHLKNAGKVINEQTLLPKVIRGDRISETPFLPISIYLDNLRSAFNVGSIIRTTEAFRIGKVVFSPKTPDVNHRKVQEVSMGSHQHISYSQISLNLLPRPLIALETTAKATSIFSFSFPSSFTLMLGNEEIGLSDEALEQADICISIPMVGFKNSLNVASAYAVAAAMIHHQQRETNGKE